MELCIKKRDLRLAGKFCHKINFMAYKGKNIIYVNKDGASIILIWDQGDWSISDTSFSFSVNANKELLKKSKKDNEKYYITINEDCIEIDGARIDISPLPVDIISKIKKAYQDYINVNNAEVQAFYIPEIADKKIDFDGYESKFTFTDKEKICWYYESNNPYGIITKVIFTSNYIKNPALNIEAQATNWY